MSKVGELIVLISQLESTGLFGFCFLWVFLILYAIDRAGLKTSVFNSVINSILSALTEFACF